MKVRAFLIADAVTTSQGKSYIHGGGITSIAGEFPLTVPVLYVLLRLEREDEPLGSDHRAALRLFTPENEQMVELTANSRLPGEASDFHPLTMDFVGHFEGLTFEQPGTYRFGAFLDDIEIDTIPLVLETDEEDGRWRTDQRDVQRS
jgi:hypothetical protein